MGTDETTKKGGAPWALTVTRLTPAACKMGIGKSHQQHFPRPERKSAINSEEISNPLETQNREEGQAKKKISPPQTPAEKRRKTQELSKHVKRGGRKKKSDVGCNSRGAAKKVKPTTLLLTGFGSR